MHNGFLKINNEKMSKSLGNFFTVRDIGKVYDLQVLRFFMLSSHYRSPINFSDELMEAAKTGLERIRTSVENINHILENIGDCAISEEEKGKILEAEKFVEKFENAMDDDCNTADAVSALFELVKFSNTTVSGESSKEYVETIKEKILVLADVLGIVVEVEKENLDADIEAKIQERQQARKTKNFALADQIRDELLAQGIILEDTREGVKWKRK
jgi:cysteinyl-tRNA synthetase